MIGVALLAFGVGGTAAAWAINTYIRRNRWYWRIRTTPQGFYAQVRKPPGGAWIELGGADPDREGARSKAIAYIIKSGGVPRDANPFDPA